MWFVVWAPPIKNPGYAYDSHRCEMCSRLLNDKECEVFDNLHPLEASVIEETLLSLIYIAGYVQKKDCVVKENDSLFYYHKFGKYVDALNRGPITLSQEFPEQWCIFCVIFFLQVLDVDFENFLLICFLNFNEVQLLCFKKNKTLCYFV